MAQDLTTRTPLDSIRLDKTAFSELIVGRRRRRQIALDRACASSTNLRQVIGTSPRVEMASRDFLIVRILVDPRATATNSARISQAQYGGSMADDYGCSLFEA